MNNARYVVPDKSPIWVKNLLTGSPSRRSVRLLVYLSMIAGSAVAIVERGKLAALLSLVFFGYALLTWLSLRWGDKNGLFKNE
jgi:hypothetical protein